jgi:hypothetical protein
MKKTVYILFLLGWLLPSNLLNAQDDRVVEAIKNSDYIFQGKFIEGNFIKKDGDKNYVSYKILVEQVYKDKKTIKEGDIVEVVSYLPNTWQVIEGTEYITNTSVDDNVVYPYNKGLKLSSGMSVLFFTKENKTNYTKSISNAILSLEPTQSFNDYYFFNRKAWKTDTVNKKAYQVDKITGFGKTFNAMEEYQNYLKDKGLDITLQNDKKKDVFSTEELNNQRIYAERVKAYNRYLNILNERVKTKTGFQSKASETITVEVQNQEITCGSSLSKIFYEYDIFVSGNSSNTYLDNIAIVTEYNQNAFSTNVSANNKIQITRGVSFNNATYIDPMSIVTDNNSNSVRFGTGSDYDGATWNRTLITPTPAKLFHVKMEISNCTNYNSDLSFIDIINVSNIAWYTVSASANPQTTPPSFYDNPTYNQPTSFSLCSSPIINDFNPKTISAGTGDTLTITGSGFGCNRGKGDVLFKNTKFGGYTDMDYLNGMDYISWSDNEIKLILPYSADSSGESQLPGSGYFQVKNSFAETTNSPSMLLIPYAVMNSNFENQQTSEIIKKIPYRQATFNNYSNQHAREFSLDTSITNNPQMSAVVHKALKDWSCLTHINWIITDTVAKDTVSSSSNRSIIFIDPTISSSTVARTSPSILYCQNQNYVYANKVNIGIARGIIWLYDTTMNVQIDTNHVDFYNAILHELGHAHFLGHVNDDTDILYYQSKKADQFNSISASERLHISNSPNQINGGKYILNHSYNLSINCEGIHVTSPYYPINCVDLSVSSLDNEAFDISIYPNPFNAEIIVKYNLDYPSDIYCTITDITGKVLKLTTFNNSTKGENSNHLMLDEISSGVYLITLRNNQKILTTKMIMKE